MAARGRKSGKPGRKEFVLKLYVTGGTRRSQRAVENLNAICEEYLSGRYELEVVDMYRSPLAAEEEGILAAPTLVKQIPAPVRRMIGDLSERGQVLMLLGLKPRDEIRV